MNTTKVEKKAVSVVRDRINRIEYFEDHIPDGDKGLLLDGHITIFRDDSGKKSSFVGNISTQVKGTETIKDLSKENIGYDVSVEDLKGFQKIGGNLFFVVAIKGEKTRIYYIAFTPVRLAILLSNCENQGHKRVNMLALPDKDDLVYSIVSTAYEDIKKQSSFSANSMISIDELSGAKDIVSVKASVQGLKSSSVQGIDLFLQNDVYLYAQKKGIKIQIPVMIDPKGFHVIEKVPCEVTVNGHNFYNEIQKTMSRKKTTITVGDCLSFDLNDDSKNNSKMTFRSSDLLSKQIKDYKFIIAAIDNGGFEISGGRINLEIKEQDRVNVEHYRSRLELLIDTEKLLKKLNVKKELDTSKITEKDNQWLPYILKSVLDEEEVVLPNKELPVHALFTLGNITLLLVIAPVKGKERTYRLYDFFHSNLIFAYDKVETNERIPTSMYCALSISEYCNVDNIDYENIAEDFRKIYNTITTDMEWGLNRVMLCLLQAYDTTKMNEQLKAAEELSNLEYELFNDNSTVALLNKLQIVKRKRDLTDEEALSLYKIVESSDETKQCKIGAYILLEDDVAALSHIKSLSKEEKDFFLEYPICNLLTSRRESNG